MHRYIKILQIREREKEVRLRAWVVYVTVALLSLSFRILIKIPDNNLQVIMQYD